MLFFYLYEIEDSRCRKRRWRRSNRGAGPRWIPNDWAAVFLEFRARFCVVASFKFQIESPQTVAGQTFVQPVLDPHPTLRYPAQPCPLLKTGQGSS